MNTIVKDSFMLETSEIFSKLKNDFEEGRFSWMGDFRDFALGYISLCSILHAHTDSVTKPVGSFVIGKTATGKTEFLEALTKLIPQELVINLTSVSAKSFIYDCRHDPFYLNGKVVFIEELSGIKNEDIQYLIRVLLTKGYASHTTVLSGQSEKIEIKGAISLQSTGLTSDVLRDDTMNRLVLFNSDESEARTHDVLASIKNRYTKKSLMASDSFLDYRDFFKSLKPYSVIIPYIDEIKFDASRFETRRLAKIFMDLLSTVALLNQKKRVVDEQEKVLISEIEDFEILCSLVEKERKLCSKYLSPSQKAVLNAIAKLSGKKDFTYKDILDVNPSDEDGKIYELSSVKKAMLRLRELDFVDLVRNGKPVYFCANERRGENNFGVYR